MKNYAKSLELLNVPSYVNVSGQVRFKTQHTILQTTTVDSTNVEVTVDPVTGKKTAKRVRKTTVAYSSVPVTQNFGGYGLNLVSSYINSFGYNPIGIDASGKITLDKPRELKTISDGPMAGQQVWFGGLKVEITPSEFGHHFQVKGFEPTAPITIMRRTVSISGTVSIKATGEFTVTNVSTTTTNQRNTSMMLEDLKIASRLTEDQLAEMSKTIFAIHNVDDNTHVTDLAANIVVNNGKYKGDAYINGIDSENIPYTSLIASMNMKFPQFVQRWRLYNGGQVNESIYGSTWMKQMAHSENNEITIIAGDSYSWDEASKTLTYDKKLPTHLWYQYECLPAQGKNEGWEYILDLATGQEVKRK